MNASRSAQFRSLHVRGTPLVLVNAWDAGSAATVAATGVAAVATSSWAIAAAHGFPDGERMPAEHVMSTFESIAAKVTVPLTVDIESGYGGTPDAVAATVERVIGMGACGCNLEDGRQDGKTLRGIPEQVELIRAARAAADRLDPDFFVNARTDVFFVASEASGADARLQEVIERGREYARAGADGLFVPGLVDPARVAEIVRAVDLPVNVMLLDVNAPIEELRRAGVARISFGPAPYRAALAALRTFAETVTARAGGTPPGSAPRE